MFGEQKTLKKIKVGYARITSEYSGDAFDSPAGAALEKGIISILESKNVEIVRATKVVNYFDKAIEVAEQMICEKVDAVVVFVASWMESTTGHTLVKELNGIPVLFWAYTMYKIGDTVDGTGSICGFSVLKGALERIEAKFTYIIGDYKDKDNETDLIAFVNAARAIKKMNRARIGLVGSFAIGQYSATIDHLLTKQKIGPEVVPISELEFMDLVNNPKEEDTNRLKKYLMENAAIDPKAGEELFGRMTAMYFAYDRLVEKYKLDSINPKCHIETSSKCMPCVPLGLLSDRNIITGCESDILISISMLLHYYLSEKVVTYFDIFDFDAKSIYFSNCGFSPLSLAASKPTLTYCNPKDWGFCGLSNGFLLKQGKVDMFRLYEKINSFALIYSRATTVETVVRGHRFPTMKVEFENAKEFVKHAPSQHLSIAYSDIKKEIEMFCKYKDIELLAF